MNLYTRLSFQYKLGSPILDDISYSFNTSQIYFIEGKNGCGKTTLLNCICGFLKYKGIILLDGIVLNSKNNDKYIDYMTQKDIFIENNTGFKNITVYLTTKNVTVNNDKINELAMKMRISEKLNLPVYLLSGGERKKISLIRSLLTEKDILLMDEPFAGLDNESCICLSKIIEEFRKNKITIIVDHEDSKKYFENIKIINLVNLKENNDFALSSIESIIHKKSTFHNVINIFPYFKETLFASLSYFPILIFISTIMLGFIYTLNWNNQKTSLFDASEYFYHQDFILYENQLNSSNNRFSIYRDLGYHEDDFLYTRVFVYDEFKDFKFTDKFQESDLEDEYIHINLFSLDYDVFKNNPNYNIQTNIITINGVKFKIDGLIKNPIDSFIYANLNSEIINDYLNTLSNTIYIDKENFKKLELLNLYNFDYLYTRSGTIIFPEKDVFKNEYKYDYLTNAKFEAANSINEFIRQYNNAFYLGLSLSIISFMLSLYLYIRHLQRIDCTFYVYGVKKKYLIIFKISIVAINLFISLLLTCILLNNVIEELNIYLAKYISSIVNVEKVLNFDYRVIIVSSSLLLFIFSLVLTLSIVYMKSKTTIIRKDQT